MTTTSTPIVKAATSVEENSILARFATRTRRATRRASRSGADMNASHPRALLSWRRHPTDPTSVPTEPAPEAATASSPPWLCRLTGHRYVTRHRPNNLDEGGFYRVCERCNHEKRLSGRPPSGIGW